MQTKSAGITLFAAIDVGSYELGLMIAECSRKRGIRVIDHVTHRINLGTDTYTTGKISYAHVAELKRVLADYRRIMDNYGVTDYRAYGTSAIREMVNSQIVLTQIEQQTGIHIDVLSNSEQRFLDYKSIAAKGEGFSRFIESGTAIVDIGGSSIQISLFDKDHLILTQNLRMGVLRLYDQLRNIDAGASRRDYVITELIDSQLTVFKNLYLKDREIRNIIVVDDYISPVLEHYISDRDNPGFTDSPSFDVFMDDLRSSNPQDFARRYDVSDDNVPLMYISGMLLSRVLRTTGAGRIWAPGVTLCDGMIYEFTENRKILPPGHDFEEDIIACAKNIGRRYMGLEERGRALENISLKIFDSTRKYHGMGGRERLLMRIAALLHDCGKYISMSDSGECSYDIIMSTEIIGLSHLEREIVANVVRYNHSSFVYFAAQEMVTDLDHDSYLTITRLTAILRIANGLDRSHMQKFQDLKAKVKDGMLVITVSAEEDLTMERGLFGDRADFFEEVYGIRPVIRQR